MSKVSVLEMGEGDWQVWITLAGHDPLEDPFGFVIGSGETRDAAVADAVTDLEAALEILQGPAPKLDVTLYPLP